MNHRGFHVSDRALLRYLERVEGINVEAFREEISTTVEFAQAADENNAVVSGGFRYRIRNDVVVNVVRSWQRRGK